MPSPTPARPTRGEASLPQVVAIALLPALIFSIGGGAIIPVIPTVAASMGAGIEFAGFIAGSAIIGQAIGNIPAGPVVSRFGERRAMFGGAVLSVGAVLVAALAPNAWIFLLGIVLIGFAGAIFNLARHAFLTSYAPLRYRARVLSTLGGVYRAGQFIGPLLSAGLIALTGVAQHAFWILVACAVLVILVLIFAPDVERLAPTGPDAVRHADGPRAADGAPNGDDDAPVEKLAAPPASDRDSEDAPAAAPAAAPREPTNIWRSIARHRAVLARLGVGAGLMALLRGARNVMLPLWALSIGMDDTTTSLVIAVSGGIDFALFFVSGWIMDRFGRAWSAVPAMVGMGLGFIALALTHDVPNAATWLIVLGAWLGLANGIGSGILMTLGADLAPPHQPAPFLAAWHLITDAASIAVPVLVAGVTAAFALPATAGVLGALGLVGAGMMGRWIPRYVPPPQRSRRGGS